MADDFSANTSTTGEVAVGGTAGGHIETADDRDWFAVALVEGRTYTIDLRGSPTDDGTLSDPCLYGIHDATGNRIADTVDDDGGHGLNSKVTFTATASGIFYIAAGAYGSNLGTYEVEVTDNSAADDVHTGATDFGDITALQGPRFPQGTLDGHTDQVDYYRFTLTEAKRVELGLRQQDANADLHLEDANGTVLYSSTNSGTANEAIGETLLAGTYYLRVESQEAGTNEHVVRYGVAAPDADALAALQQQSGTAVNAAPTFAETSYAFDLAENADGSTNRVSLGTVAATDPEGTTLAYSLVGSNESGSFEIDATSGELFYKGSGEDFESGTTQFTLTVRASDGSETADTTVTVDVTDVDEAPTTTDTDTDATRAGATDLGDITALQGPRFPQGTVDGDADRVDYYRFTLTEAKRVGLGLRQQDADANLYLEDADGNVLYRSTNSGTANEAIGETLLAGTYYLRVESQAAGTNVHVVRYGVSAPDPDAVATLQQQSDTAVNAAPTFGQQGYTFALAENADGSTNRVSLGTVAATDPEDTTLAYRLVGGNESGSFDIDAATGELFYTGAGEDFESGTTRFTLTVRASDGTETADTTVTVDVTDVDDTPAIRVADAEATEGDDTVIVFRVTLQSASTGTVTVNYATTDGTATAGEDYTATSGTLTFTPGETEKTVSVAIIDDTVEDSGETFRLLLSDPSGGSLGDTEATGTILNTDPPASVSEAEGADLPAGTTTTGEVAVDGTATGDIGSAGDRDWFAVELVAGRIYKIHLRGRPTSDGTLFDPYLYGIHDADGNLLSGTTNDDGGRGRNSHVVFTATETGIHYIAAGAFRNYQGTYELEVLEEPPTIGVADAKATEGDDTEVLFRVRLESASSGTGTVTVNYTTADGTATAGEDYTSTSGTLTFAPGETEKTVSVAIIGDTVEDSGETFRLVLSDPSGATLADSEAVGTIVETSVSEAAGEDLPIDTTTTGEVAVGGTATGNIEIEGDRDWFAVELVAGRSYVIDLRSTGPTEDGGLSDPYLYGIHDAAGDLIAGTTDDDGIDGRNSHVVFMATETGTHYIAAGAWGARYGTYELEVRENSLAEGDDYSASTSTSGRVAVGETASGNIETAGDRDWFAVELVAGRSYTVDLRGSQTNDGTLLAPYLRGIHDADGNFIAGTMNLDGGWGANSRVTFTATTSGTHYIAAGAYLSYQGTYELEVTENIPTSDDDDGDDYSSDATTTGVIAVGETITGEIETAGDRDWFAVRLESLPGEAFWIRLEGLDTGGGTLPDPYIRSVYDYGVMPLATDGDVLHRYPEAHDNDGGTLRNSFLEFEPDFDALHFIEVSGWGSAVGTYKLTIVKAPDDRSSDTATTGSVAVGGSARGNIERGYDRDWFAVELVAGTTYRIDLSGGETGKGSLRNPYLYGIYDAEGKLVANTTDDDGGPIRDSRLEFTPDATGTYYISAGAYGIIDPGTGTYTLSVVEATDDHPADATTTGAVSVGGSAAGHVEKHGDVDWYAVTLEAGTTYRIDLEGMSTGGGTLRDPVLRGIYDANGNLVPGTSDDDGGVERDSRMEFTPETRGTYYLAAGGEESSGERYPTTVGTYTLSVVEATDDYPFDAVGTLEVGGSVTGHIEKDDDFDWFAVTLEAGKSYLIDLKGSSTGDGTLRLPFIAKVWSGPDWAAVPGAADRHGSGEGDNSRVVLTPETDGTYYVYAQARLGVGTYTLTVIETQDDYSADTTAPGVIAVGGSARGEIETGHDRDWFAVTLEGGTTYQVELEGMTTGRGTLRDPYLRGIHDSDGSLLPGTQNNDYGDGFELFGVFHNPNYPDTYNSRVDFTPEETGTYYIAAGAWDDLYGTYTVSVTEAEEAL